MRNFSTYPTLCPICSCADISGVDSVDEELMRYCRTVLKGQDVWEFWLLELAPSESSTTSSA